MANDNRQMWADLGIDLAQHDVLLGALPTVFQETYLSQANRPKGMGFFDFVVGDIHGVRVRELRQHAAAGRQVVATYCVFVPDELVFAAEAVSVGLCAGTQFSVPLAEETLPRNTCPLIKSSYGFKLGRTCPYVQSSHLIVGETTCDGKKKMYELLAEEHPVYVMEVPSKKTERGRALWRGEVAAFKERLEQLTGNEVTAEKLATSTRLLNDKRRALQRLYATRKADPVPISGKDALLVAQVSFYDDPARNAQMVNALCDELEARVAAGEGVFPKGAPRILISGSPMAIPNWKLHHIVESAGAAAVCEESCIGTRAFEELVPEDGGTLDEQLVRIADRYMGIHCACFTPNDERLDDVVRLAREYRVDGVIHYNLQFCHTYANEAVKVERALAEAGIPLLRIETDYGSEDVGQLRTRVDAFLEMIRR